MRLKTTHRAHLPDRIDRGGIFLVTIQPELVGYQKEEGMAQIVTIVGGYGHVGKLVARTLRNLYPELTIRLAGRNKARAADAAAEIGGSAIYVDLKDPDTWPSSVGESSIMLVCVDHTDASFARHAINNGYDYVDITASPKLTERLAAIDDDARARERRVLLSVGLAPGLSNLLVKSCVAELDAVDEVTIAVRIGLADHYGPAAAEWTANHISAGPLVSVDFRDDRHSWGLPARFSDQFTVIDTLGVARARTSMTMENGRWTRLLSWSWGLVRRWPQASIWISRLLERLGLASSRCGLGVCARGSQGGEIRQIRAFLECRRESFVTAQIAAQACMMVDRIDEPGVYHLEEVSGIDDFGAALDRAGCELSYERTEPRS